jgi:DNA-binding NarL/FixJ family response regulator
MTFAVRGDEAGMMAGEGGSAGGGRTSARSPADADAHDGVRGTIRGDPPGAGLAPRAAEREAASDRRSERLRVIIADADPLARRAIRDRLTAAVGFVVVAEAADGVEAVELAVHYRPELLLMEVGLPRIGGIAACREVVARARGVRVVMFSVRQPRQVEVEALRAGASGFLSKDSSIEATMRALRSVARGDAAISRSLTMSLIELIRRMPSDLSGIRPVKSKLTAREWEVLDLLCSGATTARIAETLFLSEATVHSHNKNIFRKLGVHSRHEAVAVATRLRQMG